MNQSSNSHEDWISFFANSSSSVPVNAPDGHLHDTGGRVMIGADKLREMIPKQRNPTSNQTRSVLAERSVLF